MKVKIFSVELPNEPGYGEDKTKERKEKITELENKVNGFFKEHPPTPIQSTIVQWLQSSGASGAGSFTQLTAIVTY